MKRPIDVWFGLRELRFTPADAERISKKYKAIVEDRGDMRPWGIAHIICVQEGLNPEIWHESLTKVFAERKELIRR